MRFTGDLGEDGEVVNLGILEKVLLSNVGVNESGGGDADTGGGGGVSGFSSGGAGVGTRSGSKNKKYYKRKGQYSVYVGFIGVLSVDFR